MRELDLVLTRFLDERYGALSAQEQESFATLLERQDPDLLDWLTGRRDDYPAECAAAIRLLIDSN
jgi:antitoxin CptB